MTSKWPTKFNTFWVVIDAKGVAYLSTARKVKKRAIAAWLAEAGKDWNWWRRYKWTCQRCDIKVRNSAYTASKGN